MAAAGRNHVQLVKQLLSSGAAISAWDAHGTTALHSAAINCSRNPEMFRVLLAAGADPKALRSDGTTALVIALWCKETAEEVVRVLLAGGSPVTSNPNAEARLFCAPPLRNASSGCIFGSCRSSFLRKLCEAKTI